MTSTDPPLRRTPLARVHEQLGATLTDFGGWSMPLRYGSDLAEHRAVREAAGIFDISHMAEFDITGAAAGGFLDFALAGRLSALAVGRARYSLVLAESGGIVDDVIVYRLAAERFLLIANAANRAAVRQALSTRRSGFPGVVTDDVTDRYALVAVQGPAAEDILRETAGIDRLETPWDEQRYYAFTSAVFGGAPLLIARTGYTGEDGFELLVPNARANDLWTALTAAGEPRGLLPAGLAARDTLRLEAGMPLYGHELSLDVAPAQVGLARVVAGDKGAFVGRAALEARPGAPVLVGLVADGRRAGRAGYPVRRGDTAVGIVTSGALSPTLGHPVALALIEPESVAAPDLALDVRGTALPVRITDLPFYRRKK